MTMVCSWARVRMRIFDRQARTMNLLLSDDVTTVLLVATVIY